MFDPKVAVVTGASRGIGRATAVALASKGMAVTLTARTAAALAAAEKTIADEGGRAAAIPMDVSDAAAVDAAIAETERRLGPVDLLVNNAGTIARNKIVDTDEASWDEVLDVNLKGAFLCTRAVLPGMTERGRGRIVNVSSISGTLGTPRLASYCASKWGLIGFTKAAAEEVRSNGVQVFAVCPGSVDTQMLKQGLPGAKADMMPEDVANVIIYLAVYAPDAMTGAAVDIFG